MKTLIQKDDDFSKYLNKQYEDCGRVFDCESEAHRFAKTGNYRVTRLMKGVEITNPKSTVGLHQVKRQYKDHLGENKTAIYWFDRVPSGKWLVSLV